MTSLKNKLFVCLPLLVVFGTGSVFAQHKLNFDQGWKFMAIELSGDTNRLHIGKNWNDQFTTENIRTDDNLTENDTLPLNREMEHLKNAFWESVTLPHTAFAEPLPIVHPREGIAYYQKKFIVPANYKNKKLSLEFEGAMQIALVWVNGVFVKRHCGGYLPFTVDLSDVVQYGKENTITIKLDNRPNPLVPPGKAVNKMDFIYYSGVYRDVWLHIDNPLHITDANAIDRPAGGGIFVTYPSVSTSEATINIRTNVINEEGKSEKFKIVQELIDNNNHTVAINTSPTATLQKGQDKHYEQQIKLMNPSLWSPDKPYLYILRTSLWKKDHKIGEYSNKIGIRSFSINKESGLLVNGVPTRITGSNRHMSYPWIGNALSNNANKRDAVLIKNAGMNCIRLAHYPQDPSFYEACDSLGILLIDCVPGWQFYNKAETFIRNTLDDIRQMIRRDRNHPSVFLWEISLNETYPPAEFRCKQTETAKSEWLPSDSNFFTSGDSYYTKACYDVPYDDWADNIEKRDNKTYPNNAFLIREYGDFEFGGTQSTTRQIRANGEAALLQQAWNLQWEHNRNRQQYPRAIGDLTWAFFDGLAGYVTGIEGWGVADIKRIPKFSYYLFKSQEKDQQPMCYIANYWASKKTANKVIVYSNCDEIALFANNREIARQKPDRGADKPYGLDWEHGGLPFTGGDARSLESPPFTFSNLDFTPGELTAVAYKSGKKVATYSVRTPGKSNRISLAIDTEGIPLSSDGADVVFVRARLVDIHNNLVTNADDIIEFSVKGDARIISPKAVHAEAGIATILLQAGTKTGNFIIEAAGPNLKKAYLVYNPTNKLGAN